MGCCNGCCGCSPYASTITAGILGIIQSIIYGLISTPVAIIHFAYWHNYDRESSEHHFQFMSFMKINTAVKTMIVITLFFNLLWFASSIALIVSNVKRKPNANGVFQWVLITSVMMVCEALFSFYLVSIGSDHVGNNAYPLFYGSFFFLDLAALSRGYGFLFGWSCNIPLSVFVYRRYNEIRQRNKTTNDVALALNQRTEMPFFVNQQMQGRPYSMPPQDPACQPLFATGPYNPHYPYTPIQSFQQQENQPAAVRN